MPNFLEAIGLLAVGLIALAAVFVLWLFFKQSKYKKTAVPYVQRTLPEMVKWDPLHAKQFMAPQALTGTTDAELGKLFAWMSKLGQLRNFDEPKVINVNAGSNTQLGFYKVVGCQVKTYFENGDAVITIQLLDKAICYFGVRSKFSLTGVRAVLSVSN